MMMISQFIAPLPMINYIELLSIGIWFNAAAYSISAYF